MKIGIIGAGNMGGATVNGLLRAKQVAATDIFVSDKSEATLQIFRQKGVNVTEDNIEVAKASDVIMVFVKPWIVEAVLTEIRDSINLAEQLLVVVAAGGNVCGETISDALKKSGNEQPTFFRVIPNIADETLDSMTFITPFNASKEQTDKVMDIFNTLGESLIVDEKLLSVGTAIASCGLAYAMRYVRAAVEGGVEMGLYPKDALKVVLQTVKGAVSLLQESGEHPEAAIDRVTTPGGLTIKGLNAMEHAGFTSAVIKGLKASAN